MKTITSSKPRNPTVYRQKYSGILDEQLLENLHSSIVRCIICWSIGLATNIDCFDVLPNGKICILPYFSTAHAENGNDITVYIYVHSEHSKPVNTSVARREQVNLCICQFIISQPKSTNSLANHIPSAQFNQSQSSSTDNLANHHPVVQTALTIRIQHYRNESQSEFKTDSLASQNPALQTAQPIRILQHRDQCTCIALI